MSATDHTVSLKLSQRGLHNDDYRRSAAICVYSKRSDDLCVVGRLGGFKVITMDVIIFGLMSLGILSVCVVGWSLHAWKKIKERQDRIDDLNDRVQRLLDSGDE